MDRRLSVLLAGAVVALAVSGCARSTAVPKIDLDPLDVSAFATQPCQLLAPWRASRRHLVPPGAPDADGCHWQPSAAAFPPITAGVTLGSGVPDLQRRQAEFPFFQLTDIDHYPAVQTAGTADGPRNGHCTVHVGVSGNSTVDVSADYPKVSRGNGLSA
ncbi:MAG TPA: DUF3558 family protein, partial [Pseudonocardia sp.]